jgi:hypothetical protein
MTNSPAQDAAAELVQQEYERMNALSAAQPALVQRFIEAQARQLADSVVQRTAQTRFTLPDKVVIDPDKPGAARGIPVEQREQLLGGFMDRLTRSDVRAAVRQRLAELEQHSDKAVSIAGELIRHATAIHMVHNMLPSGRSVTYIAAPGEEIATIPAGEELEPSSAITATTDAIAEAGESPAEDDAGRGELLVPYVPAARRFYLPQWVAFDEQDHLLVNSVAKAESNVASMQRFIEVLHAAVALAPYMVADSDYQQKRYGMLGQLVNQGRALARYQTGEIVSAIRRRASANDLNRGLSLSLPYFDDQELEMKTRYFEIIPAGRIMFVPAFVVRGAREEEAKVAQDTRLSPSTRTHLMSELRVLEQAFLPKSN